MNEIKADVRVDTGLVSRRIFFDPDVYQEELARIFAKCWLFLGHESQIPNPGDYVAGYMGEDPVITWRGEDGKIRVFLNSCRHRGMKVCRTDCGNAPRLQCSFHGWTYSTTGDLVGVPSLREGYRNELDRTQWGLLRAPKVASYGGLVFASWDEGAGSLDDYLGDLRWYLDVLIERQLGGLEFLPGQQRYALKANWKIAGENFAGDTYHLGHSHGSLFKLDVRQINPINPLAFGKGLVYNNVSFANGHGLTGLVTGGERYELDLKLAAELGPEVVEYVRECRHRLESRLSPKQAALHALAFGNVFPNFSLNDFSALRPIGIYLWHPRGPGALESWQWCAIDAQAPQVVKDICRIDFPRTQAVAGIAAQDDTENFEQVTEATRGVIGRQLDFNYQMNLGNDAAVAKEGYPGKFAPYVSETNQLGFYGRWAQLMGDGAQRPGT
jgi:dibenzofuran dioxygenase subunit alpha